MWPGQIFTEHVGVQRRMRKNRPKSDSDLFRFTVCWLKSIEIHWNPHLGCYRGRVQNPVDAVDVRMALNPWVRVRWFGDEDCKRSSATAKRRCKRLELSSKSMGRSWGYFGHIYICMWYIIYVSMCIYIRNTPGMDGDLMKILWRPAPECANGNILSMVQTMDWGYLLQHFNDTELPHFFSQEQRRWKTARDMDSWCEMTYWLDMLHGKSIFLIRKSLFLMGNHYFK